MDNEGIRPKISTNEVAKLLKCSPQNVTYLTRKGKINKAKIGKQKVYYLDEIKDYIKNI